MNTRIVGVSLVTALAVMTAACSKNKLTREKAADLIRPQVIASMTLSIPDGGTDAFQFILFQDYANALAERGVVTISTNKNEPEYSSKRVLIAPTPLARPLVIQHKQMLSDATSPAVVLAEAKFRDITGLRETDESGKNAEVEFTWNWNPTPVGAALDGAILKRSVQSAITVDVVHHYYPAKATCSLYDDGWRCAISDWRRDHFLNDAF